MIRIAIVGPESTGKSLLAERLAHHYQTQFVPEVAREYLNAIDRKYTLEDISDISKLQMKSEDQIAKDSNKILFCDTSLLVTKVWAEHIFHQVPNYISENILLRKYDLHLLTNIDLPWEQDPLREHPHLREYFFEVYHNLLKSLNQNFKIVSGIGDARLQNAIEHIETWKQKENLL